MPVLPQMSFRLIVTTERKLLLPPQMLVLPRKCYLFEELNP
jgi:hypothetical protein